MIPEKVTWVDSQIGSILSKVNCLKLMICFKNSESNIDICHTFLYRISDEKYFFQLSCMKI